MPKYSFLNWLYYSNTEQKYATLLDIQIRHAFQEVNLSDLKTCDGFANLKNASQGLKNFFECRKIFEQFIGDDITEHSQQKAQLQAFKKWMNVAEILLQKHNYEACCLVIYRLSQIDMDFKLSQELSLKNKNSFDTLEAFASPKSNFKVLREHLKSNPNPRNLFPTFILSKDMTTLNEVQKKDTESKQKDEVLSQGIPQKEQDIPTLSKHLKNTFKLITERYRSEQSEVATEESPQQSLITPLSIMQRESGSQPVRALPKASNLPKSEWQSSTLVYSIYNQKISPSFWTRCLQDHYCKKMLTAEEVSPRRHP